MKRMLHIFFILTLGLSSWTESFGQGNVLINLASLDGLDITPDNILNFQIQSFLKMSTHTTIEGVIRYRDNQERITYRFPLELRPGMNLVSMRMPDVQFSYSSPAIRELFTRYKKLPGGIYEYCVTVKTDIHNSESESLTFNECLYHRSVDLFLINLIAPENGEKVKTFYPMFSWVANYPFVSSLSYKISVVKMKRGQNAATAIRRNSPVFREGGLTTMGKLYPVYAEPLETEQLYAWTVDAFYKDLFLGTAAPWQFMIEPDSLLEGVPLDPSFVDIVEENPQNLLFAPGIVKLKYDLKARLKDTLDLKLLDPHNEIVKLQTSHLEAKAGDNRFIINFKDDQPLKHLSLYTLIIQSQTGISYRIRFKYVNPIYIAK